MAIEDEALTVEKIAANEVTAATIASSSATHRKPRSSGSLIDWLEDLRRRGRRPRLDDNVPVPLWLLLVILASTVAQVVAFAMMAGS